MDETISISDRSVIFQQDDLANNAFTVLDELRKQEKLCDVTIKVEDSYFKTHRVVLCATIPYFNAMFTNDMLESKQREVEVQGIDPTSMKSLIEFVYSGKVVIDCSNVQKLMIGASYLQLNKVRDACADYFKQRLECSNVLGILSLAETLSCVDLVETADRFVEHNFTQVTEKKEFLNIEVNQIQELLSRDALLVNEEKAFEALIRWVKKNPDTRSKHLPKLLDLVRLPLLSPVYLTDCVAKEDLIRSCPECRDQVEEARDFQLLRERKLMIQDYRCRPRFAGLGLLYAVGMLGTERGSMCTAVEVMNPISGNWSQVESMLIKRIGSVGVAVHHNKLYAIGGINGYDSSNIVEVLDLSERKWSQIESMNCNRSDLGAVSLHENIYVCGGLESIDDDTALNTVEKYDPFSDSWAFISPMNQHRSSAGVVAFDNQIYVLGGVDAGGRTLDSVEKYNPQTGLWSPGPSMLSKRSMLGVAVLDGKLYACGGNDGVYILSSVEVYDPRNNKWSPVASMSKVRNRVALAANGGKLWAVGGHGSDKHSTVEVYGPRADKWSFGPSMYALKGEVCGLGVVPFSVDDFTSYLP